VLRMTTGAGGRWEKTEKGKEEVSQDGPSLLLSLSNCTSSIPREEAKDIQVKTRTRESPDGSEPGGSKGRSAERGLGGRSEGGAKEGDHR
jgi:hypothetical protein